MKTEDFNRMISHCIKQYEIADRNKVFVCVSWKDDEFHPITYCDTSCDGGSIVIGSDLLQFNKFMGPNYFYVNADGYHRDRIIHDCYTLQQISTEMYNDGHEIKFVISTPNAYPQNIVGDINPHMTYFLKNANNVKFLVFKWDARAKNEGPQNSDEMTFKRVVSYLTEPDPPYPLDRDLAKDNI